MGNPSYSGGLAVPRVDLGVAFMEHMGQRSNFIARQILTPIGVPRQAAKFPKLKRSSMLRPGVVKRASGAGYNRIAIEATDDSYSCEERGAEAPIDDRLKSIYANEFDLEVESTKQAGDKILLDQEIDVAAAIQDPVTNWPSGDSALYTDVTGGAGPWDTASSDVIGAIRAAKEKVRRLTGMDANTLILSEVQFLNLLANDDILLRFPGAPKVTEDMLLSNLGPIFGIEKLLRGKGVKNTASEGAAASLSDVWSDDYALVCRTAPAGASFMEPCIGRTFIWTEQSQEELIVETYRDEKVRAGVVRARQDTDEKLIDTSFGHLLKID
jgi:hypothetical protein